jgi:hypothetical protein
MAEEVEADAPAMEIVLLGLLILDVLVLREPATSAAVTATDDDDDDATP